MSKRFKLIKGQVYYREMSNIRCNIINLFGETVIYNHDNGEEHHGKISWLSDALSSSGYILEKVMHNNMGILKIL